MNLLADEGIDWAVVDRLRREGHDVVYIAELSPSITDEEVLREANDRAALLLTADKDFGELVYRLGRLHNGVVLLRLAGLAVSSKSDIIVEALRDHDAELPRAFTVIAPGLVRIRPSPNP